MRVTCERCQVEYELRDDRVLPGGVQVQCTHCQHMFVARHPPVLDTVVLSRSEKELLTSLLADLQALRRAPMVQPLGGDLDDEPTVRTTVPPTTTGLREIANVRQVPGESSRRWFTSGDLDLILWLGARGEPYGFQLCYGKTERNERAVTWWPERGLKHSTVDDGRRDPLTVKGTPTLAATSAFDAPAVLARFLAARGELQGEVFDFVAQRLSA